MEIHNGSQSQAMSVLTSHKSVEWFTPVSYIELVKEVIGEIDLDPASNALANSWIKAKRYFDGVEKDGLKEDWTARSIFLNPPYSKTNGKSNQAVWSEKMCEEYLLGNFDEGILLVNNTAGYKWFEFLWLQVYTCCVRERIRFIKEDGTVGGQAKRGQVFCYFGENPEKFILTFSKIGRIIPPDQPIDKSWKTTTKKLTTW